MSSITTIMPCAEKAIINPIINNERYYANVIVKHNAHVIKYQIFGAARRNNDAHAGKMKLVLTDSRKLKGMRQKERGRGGSENRKRNSLFYQYDSGMILVKVKNPSSFIKP